MFLCLVVGMKILVVESVWHGGESYAPFERLYLNTFGIYPSLHARQIASIASMNHEVLLASERYGPLPYERKWDVVIVHATLSATPHALEIASRFKKKNIPVVFAGYLGNVYPETIAGDADSILQGRGELEILECLEDIESGDFKTVYPAKSYDSSIKIPRMDLKNRGFSIVAPVEATRGCPHRCEFCMECGINKKPQYFKRPIEEVVEEIKKLPQKFLMFYDESLTVDIKYVSKLFEELKPLKKHFFCNGNVDVLAQNPDLVKLSKDAGCVSWLVGFESFSAQSLVQVKKSSNSLELYQTAVENIHKNKMSVIGSFMFGFDDEDKSVFCNTLKAISNLRIDAADFNVLTPIPGTPFYERLEAEGRILTKDWTRYSMHQAVFRPKKMSASDLEAGVRFMYETFYSPKNFLNTSFQSLHLGLYPSLLVLGRLGIAFSMGLRKN